MKVVILAGGEGSRLRPLTLEIPKPLIEIAGKPIIERIIESLPESIEEVVMVVAHLKEKLQSHLGDNFLGRKITYVEQGEKKGTFGALLSAQNLLDKSERFLVLNGDDLHQMSELEKFLEHPRAFGIQKTIMPNYYHVIVEGERVEGFRSQTDEEKLSGALVATGVYILDPTLFEHEGVLISGGEYGLPQTILAQKDNSPITAVLTTGWHSINSLSDIEKVHKYFERPGQGRGLI